jgi:hypothetical protein
MKNVRLTTYAGDEIARVLENRINPTVRSQVIKLLAAINSKEAFTVNTNQMTSGQRDMIHGVIRDVANHTGYTFDEMKEQVKKQFGITGSFKDLSQAQSIDLCEQIRAWLNNG